MAQGEELTPAESVHELSEPLSVDAIVAAIEMLGVSTLDHTPLTWVPDSSPGLTNGTPSPLAEEAVERLAALTAIENALSDEIEATIFSAMDVRATLRMIGDARRVTPQAIDGRWRPRWRKSRES